MRVRIWLMTAQFSLICWRTTQAPHIKHVNSIKSFIYFFRFLAAGISLSLSSCGFLKKQTIQTCSFHQMHIRSTKTLTLYCRQSWIVYENKYVKRISLAIEKLVSVIIILFLTLDAAMNCREPQAISLVNFICAHTSLSSTQLSI